MKTASSVLDASALLAYFQQEEGFKTMVSTMSEAKSSGARLLINEINLGEVYYTTARRQSQKAADFILYEAIPQLPIETVSNTSEDIIDAARLKARLRLPYADSFAAVLAIRRKAVLLTCDRDFEAVAGEVEIKWLR